MEVEVGGDDIRIGIICRMLRDCGFTVESCADRLLPDSGKSSTWFVIARKEVPYGGKTG